MKKSVYIFFIFIASSFTLLVQAQSKDYISITKNFGTTKIKLTEQDYFTDCGVGLPESIIEQKIENGFFNSVGINYTKGFQYISISSGFELENVNYSVNTESIISSSKMSRIAIPISLAIESPNKFGFFASLGMAIKWNYRTISNITYYSNDAESTFSIISNAGIKYNWNKLQFKIGHNYQNEMKNDNYRIGFNQVVLRESGFKMLGTRLNTSSIFLSIGYEI